MRPYAQADPCSGTLNGESPIHVAVAQGSLTLLACLIQEQPGGILDDLRDSQGNNPLHGVPLVSVSNEHDMHRMAALLLSRGMQIDSPGEICHNCSNPMQLSVKEWDGSCSCYTPISIHEWESASESCVRIEQGKRALCKMQAI